jgi:cysteine synthase
VIDRIINDNVILDLKASETSLIKRLEKREKEFGIVSADQLLTSEDRTKQYTQLEKMVGHTPLSSEHLANGSTLWIKNETENPTESHYDRVMINILNKLEGRGIIKPGDTILEETSGSAGRSLAYFCNRLGFKLNIIVPQELPQERSKDMLTFGANLIKADKMGGIGAVNEKFKRMLVGFRREGYQTEKIEFEGPVWVFRKNDQTICAPNHSESNITPQAFEQIAKEVIEQLPPNAKLDVFIGTLGNGSTIKGISGELRRKFPNIKIIGTEDYKAPVNAVRKLELEYPNNSEMVKEKFREEYGYEMPNNKDYKYHESFGASTPGTYMPPFIEIQNIDEILLMKGEWHSLKRLQNMYALLNDNISNVIGNTSSENLFTARVIVSGKVWKDKNILILFYDKGDQYADWPPHRRGPASTDIIFNNYPLSWKQDPNSREKEEEEISPIVKRLREQGI